MFLNIFVSLILQQSERIYKYNWLFLARHSNKTFCDVLYIQVSFVWPLSIVLQSRMDLIDSWDLLSKCILTKKTFI